MTASNRVDGQVALVTGASRGIGRAIALALAERGADVVALSRTVGASEVVAAEVRARGRRALAGGGDVADWRAVQRQELQVLVTQGRLFRPEQPAAAIAWLASPVGGGVDRAYLRMEYA